MVHLDKCLHPQDIHLAERNSDSLRYCLDCTALEALNDMMVLGIALDTAVDLQPSVLDCTLGVALDIADVLHDYIRGCTQDEHILGVVPAMLQDTVIVHHLLAAYSGRVVKVLGLQVHLKRHG